MELALRQTRFWIMMQTLTNLKELKSYKLLSDCNRIKTEISDSSFTGSRSTKWQSHFGR